MVTAKIGVFESENATLLKKFETFSKPPEETEAVHAANVLVARDDLGTRMRECDALRAKIDEL